MAGVLQLLLLLLPVVVVVMEEVVVMAAGSVGKMDILPGTALKEGEETINVATAVRRVIWRLIVQSRRCVGGVVKKGT